MSEPIADLQPEPPALLDAPKLADPKDVRIAELEAALLESRAAHRRDQILLVAVLRSVGRVQSNEPQPGVMIVSVVNPEAQSLIVVPSLKPPADVKGMTDGDLRAIANGIATGG